ncbi:MAG: lysyl oxidase family protein [Dehalococcoidia bacterium]
MALLFPACGDGNPMAEHRPFGRPPDTATPAPLAGGAEPSSGDPTAVPSATAHDPGSQPGRELLPDLQIMSPRELYIEDTEGARKIRFSTTVVNAGEGPLDIAGSYDADAGITTATQRIHHEDGDVVEEIAGRFVFHPGHEHWHFKDFTMLELWTYGCDGELDEMKATTGKGTFCAVDEVLADETLPHVPEGPSFLECGQGVQGLSVGWSDTYTADLIGQELDIDGVPDGRYAVRTLADPAGRLREKDDDNNDLVVYVEITGAEIELLDGP